MPLLCVSLYSACDRRNRSFKLTEDGRLHNTDGLGLLRIPPARHIRILYLQHRCPLQDYEPQAKPGPAARVQKDEVAECLLCLIHERLLYGTHGHPHQTDHRNLRRPTDSPWHIYCHRLDADGVRNLLP